MVAPEVVVAVAVAETEAGAVVLVVTTTWSSWISQPEIARAPTCELLSMVVVRVVYVPECVDAYVYVWPDVILDTHRPVISPATAP